MTQVKDDSYWTELVGYLSRIVPKFSYRIIYPETGEDYVTYSWISGRHDLYVSDGEDFETIEEMLSDYLKNLIASDDQNLLKLGGQLYRYNQILEVVRFLNFSFVEKTERDSLRIDIKDESYPKCIIWVFRTGTIQIQGCDSLLKTLMELLRKAISET